MRLLKRASTSSTTLHGESVKYILKVFKSRFQIWRQVVNTFKRAPVKNSKKGWYLVEANARPQRS